MPTESTHRLCSDVRFRILGGEAVVLRQDTAEMLVLNEFGPGSPLKVLD